MRFFAILTFVFLIQTSALYAQTVSINPNTKTVTIGGQPPTKSGSSTSDGKTLSAEESKALDAAAMLLKSQVSKDLDAYNKGVQDAQSLPLFDGYAKDKEAGVKKSYYVDPDFEVQTQKGGTLENEYLQEQWQFQDKYWNEGYKPLSSDENYKTPDF